MSVLFVINNVINTFLSPYIGRAVNRFGERKVLGLEYASLVFVFLGYALVESAWLAGVLYVLDHVFFNFALAIRTYFQKIADPADIAPSMAVGLHHQPHRGRVRAGARRPTVAGGLSRGFRGRRGPRLVLPGYDPAHPVPRLHGGEEVVKMQNTLARYHNTCIYFHDSKVGEI